MLQSKPSLVSIRLFCRASMLLVLAALVGGTGCGGKGPATQVKGKITLNGAGVDGTVSFIGPDGKSIDGPVLMGVYFIDNPPIGTCKVVVKAPPKMGSATGAKGGKDTGGAVAPEMGVAAPPKYSKPETSGLEYTVKKGNQVKDFELTP